MCWLEYCGRGKPFRRQAPLVWARRLIRDGELRGSLADDGGAVFKGIPFAQPPVGNLRWHEPIATGPWSGIREATAFGPACMQSGGLGANSSEDCLYLNVWTPKWPMKKPAAVMVWIYGGGNFAELRPTRLSMAKASFVTASYWLQSTTAWASWGSWRTRYSLRNHRTMFPATGDCWTSSWHCIGCTTTSGHSGEIPGNVTIFGESAGSLDVNVLAASPLSKGLFERVIGKAALLSPRRRCLRQKRRARNSRRG